MKRAEKRVVFLYQVVLKHVSVDVGGRMNKAFVVRKPFFHVREKESFSYLAHNPCQVQDSKIRGLLITSSQVASCSLFGSTFGGHTDVQMPGLGQLNIHFK